MWNKPEIDFRSWKTGRKRYVLFDLEFRVSVFGICLFGIEVLVYQRPLDLVLYLGILGFSISFASEETPKFDTFNGWKQSCRGRVLDIQSELTALGFCLFGIEVVIWRKPFAYDLFFALLGFGFTLGSK